jgi:3',5'-cyclic AMP phosphodiesterase CpdA
METLFRWIHLSDIHFGHGDAAHGWDQKLVIESLRRDIGVMLQRDPTPVDAILVTGDIAFSGNGRRPTEYSDADATLRALATAAGVTPSQIFLVPGNHDVNRASDRDRNVQRLLESLRTGRDKIDTALADAGDRGLLARRMSAYLDFAQGFAPACLSASPPPPEQRLYWTHRLTSKRGLALRMVGLNSAMLSADDKDQGQLYLGREQIAKALLDPPVAPGELVMVLSHHPFRAGWLGDEKDVDAWVRNNAHVHLSGHVHEADTEQSRSGAGGSFVRITAGATHGDAEPAGVPPSHGYSFGAVGREGGKALLRVWPRKWSPKNTTFRTDHDNVPDGQDFAEHDLSKLTVPTQATGAAGAKGEPIEIFFSYAPEDEELKTKLEKHLSLLRRKGIIKSFAGRTLDAGESWKGVVDERLRSAKIILLLISNDYLASDYCLDTEMNAAHERMEAGEARVIPILLRPSDFSNAADTSNNERAKEVSWFEKLQPLPTGNRAATQWSNLDEALTDIAKQIRLIAENLR